MSFLDEFYNYVGVIQESWCVWVVLKVSQSENCCYSFFNDLRNLDNG